MNKATMVSLVGAGPGDRELITVKGLQCLRSADYLIYDRLIDSRLLEEVPEGCALYDVGKRAYSHYMPQEEITELVVSCARKGGHVVRLKGGDPYVFGRGGEEALRLVEEGIDFQVVPGVTSAVAGLCYAGVPVTHRELARSFHVITAHTAAGGMEESRYPQLAALEGTLVFLMGLAQTEKIAAGLMAAGKAPETPALVVSNAATPKQKTVRGSLADIGEKLRTAGLVSPAIICVGEAAALGEQLNFFEKRPLFGKRILVTSAREKTTKLAPVLEGYGAQVLSLPMLRLESCTEAMEPVWPRMDAFRYILFTSSQTVKLFFDGLWASGRDLRAVSGAKLCAIGSATAAALEQRGLRADMVPERPAAEGLLELLVPVIKPTDRVLLPQSEQARPILRQTLEKLCRVEYVPLYRSVPLQKSGEPLPEADAVVFTSALAAETFCEQLGAPGDMPCFSIGPVTSAALAKYGVPAAESPESDMETLAECICRYFDGEEKGK